MSQSRSHVTATCHGHMSHSTALCNHVTSVTVTSQRQGPNQNSSSRWKNPGSVALDWEVAQDGCREQGVPADVISVGPCLYPDSSTASVSMRVPAMHPIRPDSIYVAPTGLSFERISILHEQDSGTQIGPTFLMYIGDLLKSKVSNIEED